ncbi:hypothetical protein PQX77_022130 [Marasmius sp. AFHP31]|nr:hypothetical protein PQX77_022130 [Marasmius sp. AFHP31]
MNSKLVPYLTRHNVIPETQLASHPGAQSRDVISFLSQIESWSFRSHTPLYALKRDQTKGFDCLEPEGFYDAIAAYGLPASLIEFDRSALANIPYRVKTAFGLTDSFIVSGVNKQGAPSSPLKFVLTTSLGNRWVTDFLRGSDNLTSIRSLQSLQGHPHTPLDDAHLEVCMIEAMDDSILIAPSPESLSEACLMLETSQFAYRWLANWDKSMAFYLNVPDPPTRIQIRSIAGNGPQPLQNVLKDVDVASDHFEFLRVKVNRPSHQYDRIISIVDNFHFPNLYAYLPFTAIRRIISQSLISRIRPLLSLQPISPLDASRVDLKIATKIHNYFSFVYRFNSSLLHLPIAFLGFDFPSVSHLNSAYLISGLLRDLNHSVSPLSSLSTITLADWMCSGNSCRYPFDGMSISSPHPTICRYSRRLPYSWFLAYRTLRSLGLSIRSTDSSFTFTGDVALHHLFNSIPHTLSKPTPTDLSRLEKFGIHLLKHIGTWAFTYNTRSFEWAWSRTLPHWTPPLLQSFHRFRDWLKSFSLPTFAKVILGHSLRTRDIIPNDLLLLVPPTTRQFIAEQTLLHYLRNSSFRPLHQPSLQTNTIFASDGSMVPPALSFSSLRSVTSSIATPCGSTPLSLALFRNSSVTAHAEIYGLIGCSLTAATCYPDRPSTIYSDHLNSVNLIHDPTNDARISTSPYRSLYRWLFHIIRNSPSPITFTYTPAHTNHSDIQSTSNAFADSIASSSHSRNVPLAPLPTFFMDRYTLFSSSDGYIEQNIVSFVTQLCQLRTTQDPLSRPNLTLLRHLYDSHPPPLHPYTRASSGYSALVQLYARSCQLETSLTRFLRMGDRLPWCCFGCIEAETIHHVFVRCPRFADWRATTSAKLALSTKSILLSGVLSRAESTRILFVADVLLQDHSVWPLGVSRYYLGLIPPILDSPAFSHSPDAQKMRAKISMTWHNTLISLTA